MTYDFHVHLAHRSYHAIHFAPCTMQEDQLKKSCLLGQVPQ